MNTKVKKNLAVVFLALVLVVAACGAWYYNSHVFVEKTPYPKNAQLLDLRGKEISREHYDSLRQLLPNCEIRWDVPFQGRYLPEDTRELTVSSLTEEDMEMLRYLPKLCVIKAEECTDYPRLLELTRQYPEMQISYRVDIGGEMYPQNTRKIVYDGDEPAEEELLEKLKYLPQLQTLHFVQPETSAETLRQLRQELPGTAITWEKDAFGETYGDDVAELDFSEKTISSVEEVESLMAYFPSLEKVFLGLCGLDNEELAAYRDRVRPEYKVAWTVVCGRFTTRTDAESLMSYKHKLFSIYDEELENLKYCEDMICVDLGHNYLRSCDWAAYMPNLKYLILAHNNYLTDISGLANCKKLVYLEIGWTALRDISPLIGCTALEDINMKYIYCDPEPLVQMPWLKNVFWSGCPSRNYETLKNISPDTYLLLEEEDWNTKHWRKLQNYYNQRDVLGMWYMD